MPRLKLTVAYVGTAFAGWQIQAKAPARPRTVQEELEKAVAALTGGHVRVHGAGRTDSGVHAEAQVAHLDLPTPSRPVDWLRAFNALLPQDLSVLAVEKVTEDFHARFSATGKHYAYALWLARCAVPPRLRPFVWECGPLDLPAMEEAALHLIGTHDFASFRNAGTDVETSVRTLRSIQREELSPLHHIWHFQGNGFLKQMVRNLMGLLVSVGRGKTAPAEVPGLLAAQDRTALPSATAPAKGLTLVRVLY